MAKVLPVGGTQKEVLDLLGLTAKDWDDANNKFKTLGIVVGSKRQGRTSIPQVWFSDGARGSVRNEGGDFDTFDNVKVTEEHTAAMRERGWWAE